MKKLLVMICAIMGVCFFSACPEPDTSWDKVTIYMITFNPDGGEIIGNEQPADIRPNMKIWVYESKPIEYLPIAEREQHTFKGWFTRRGGLGEPFTNTTRVFADREVFAHWE